MGLAGANLGIDNPGVANFLLHTPQLHYVLAGYF
jgi:hypothetical protein